MFNGLKIPLVAVGTTLSLFAVSPVAGQVAEHEQRIDALTEEIQENLADMETSRKNIVLLMQQDKDLRAANLRNDAVRRNLSDARHELKSVRTKTKRLIQTLEEEFDQAICQRKENLRKAKTLLDEFRDKLEVSLSRG